MKLILSTSNTMSGSPSVIRRPFFEKSNTELTSSLRANFSAHQSSPPPAANGTPSRRNYKTWTTRESSNGTLFIPTHTPAPLSEPRESYDITVKLFYLPNIPADRRGAQTREAIELVLKELGTTSINLLIVSFPGISFDADDEDGDSDLDDETTSAPPSTSSPTTNNPRDGDCLDADIPPEDMDSMIATWRTLETLQKDGLVSRLGIAELGVTRLAKFLENVSVKPSVNQINVRDCCVVPKPLILFAKQHSIELLTHNDCTNILPRGTLRQLLGSGKEGCGVLAGEGNEDGLRGNVEPQWVVKYTAVIKDRGVVESKGYFAAAELIKS
ncbi:hypothetical protein NX059_001084 [Plenodomus lindquistii]|nr:hypothetical protein NX059_001084 [Plenodomus lindquistii]